MLWWNRWWEKFSKRPFYQRNFGYKLNWSREKIVKKFIKICINQITESFETYFQFFYNFFLQFFPLINWVYTQNSFDDIAILKFFLTTDFIKAKNESFFCSVRQNLKFGIKDRKISFFRSSWSFSGFGKNGQGVLVDWLYTQKMWGTVFSYF